MIILGFLKESQERVLLKLQENVCWVSRDTLRFISRLAAIKP
ncbi:hypothetical protein [Phascolarctobacterium faecium]|jgi:hypothetical protein